MKKQFFLFAALFLFVFNGFAAETSRTFPVTNFSKLSLGSAFKIDVTQGSQFKVTATGEAADLDDLEANVSGGTLSVKYNNRHRNNRKGVRIRIEMPSLAAVDFSGASTASVSGFKNRGEMKIAISGASTVTMDFEAKSVSLDLSGASNLKLNGKADALEGDISGASSLKARDFSAKEVELDASGASSAAIFASASLRGDASGASSIRYAGGARDIRVNTTGASSIKKADR